MGVPIIGATPQPAKPDDDRKIVVSFDDNGAHINVGGASIDQIIAAAFHLNRVAGMLIDNQVMAQQQNQQQIAAIAANPRRTD